MAASTPTTPPATTSTKKRRRVILVNGWLRSWTYPKLWMAPLAHHLNTTRYQADVVLEVRGNTLPVQTADTEKYIQHLADLMGPDGPDAETYFIGQSIGCQVILRYLARLPPGAQVGGCLCVGCWLTLDHTTRRRRSSAIDELIRDEWETFERGWMDHTNVDFKNVQRVCPPGKLLALMADNDPYRGLDDDGLSNKRDFEEIVGAEVVFRHGKGHFNCARLDDEDVRLVEAFLGVVREAPRELVLLPAEPTQAKKAKTPSSGSAQHQRRRAHVSKPRRSKL